MTATEKPRKDSEEQEEQVRDTHVTNEQSPRGVGVDAQLPNTMPRSEDDEITRARSRHFHDSPGSGSDIARRHEFFG